MTGDIDIYTILFLVLAVVIFLRLRSVLGRRTGHERPPVDYSAREQSQSPAQAGERDNVVPMPGAAQPTAMQEETLEDAEDRVRDFMPKENDVQAGLLEIVRRDRSFDPQQFIGGAKAAYEMIVTAFAEGNKKVLKPLLAPEVYEGFVQSIDARRRDEIDMESRFVGINSADIIEAEVKDASAHVTIKFVSQLITAMRNKQGEVVDGDPKKVREVTDIWTFAREVPSNNPNWQLIATQAAN
ncbi:MAG: Tim44/TimA family putative adaptor protein [Pseudomonadota bacterium]